MKNLLSSLAGATSYSVVKIISFIVSCSPMFFIDIPWIWMFLILLGIGLISIVPVIGNLGYIGFWTWGFVGALNADINVFVILFFIAYGIAMIYHILMIFAYLSAMFGNSNR